MPVSNQHRYIPALIISSTTPSCNIYFLDISLSLSPLSLFLSLSLSLSPQLSLSPASRKKIGLMKKRCSLRKRRRRQRGLVEEECTGVEGATPTPMWCRLARYVCLFASLSSGHYPEFLCVTPKGIDYVS